mgnify:CR=1 FL=1
MKLAVMQPYLFPYIGYWQLINAVDYFVIYDDVNFIKKSFINRNSVLVNNESKLITLELFGASQNKQINEIEVGNNFEKVLKTIELNYKRAPYFESAFPVFNKVLRNKEGMGLGDAKLLGAIGFWFGWISIPFVIFISSLVALIAVLPSLINKSKKFSSEIPFGPFIIIGCILYIIFIEQYKNLIFG